MTRQMTDGYREVVTCFLRNRGDALVLLRSDEVSSYSGKWGGVSGGIEDEEAVDSAWREIEEETSLRDKCELVNEGDSFEFTDDSIGVDWRVYPFLFNCRSREVDVNPETDEVRWIDPLDIDAMDTVPRLWDSYISASPSLETISKDRSHGSTVITEDSEPRDVWNELRELAVELIESQDSMIGLRNAVNMAMSSSEGNPGKLVDQAYQEIKEIHRNTDSVVENTRDIVQDKTVLVHSRSGTLIRSLGESSPDKVVVSEARPRNEGVGTAEELARNGLDVTLITDAGMAQAVEEFDVDLMLVGADTINPDGHLVNKTGTRAMSYISIAFDIPLYVASTTYKITSTGYDWRDMDDPELIYSGDAEIDIWNPIFDVTDSDGLDGYITEDGILGVDNLDSYVDIWSGISGWQK